MRMNKVKSLDDSPAPPYTGINEEFAAYLQKVYQNAPKWDGRATQYDKLAFAAERVRDHYRKQLLTPFRDVFDFSSWVSIRSYNDVISLIPGSDMEIAHIFDFMANDSRLTDWHYQNQSDDEAESKDPED